MPATVGSPAKRTATAHRTCVHEPYGDALHCGGQGTFYCDRDKTVLDGIVAKLTRVVASPAQCGINGPSAGVIPNTTAEQLNFSIRNVRLHDFCRFGQRHSSVSASVTRHLLTSSSPGRPSSPWCSCSRSAFPMEAPRSPPVVRHQRPPDAPGAFRGPVHTPNICLARA